MEIPQRPEGCSDRAVHRTAEASLMRCLRFGAFAGLHRAANDARRRNPAQRCRRQSPSRQIRAGGSPRDIQRAGDQGHRDPTGTDCMRQDRLLLPYVGSSEGWYEPVPWGLVESIPLQEKCRPGPALTPLRQAGWSIDICPLMDLPGNCPAGRIPPHGNGLGLHGHASVARLLEYRLAASKKPLFVHTWEERRGASDTTSSRPPTELG
jgi:hypothetical protein